MNKCRLRIIMGAGERERALNTFLCFVVVTFLSFLLFLIGFLTSLFCFSGFTGAGGVSVICFSTSERHAGSLGAGVLW